jgi:hypothetical protein
LTYFDGLIWSTVNECPPRKYTRTSGYNSRMTVTRKQTPQVMTRVLIQVNIVYLAFKKSIHTYIISKIVEVTEALWPSSLGWHTRNVFSLEAVEFSWCRYF